MLRPKPDPGWQAADREKDDEQPKSVEQKDKSHAKYKGETKHTFPQTSRLTSSATATARPTSRWWHHEDEGNQQPSPTAGLQLGGRLKLSGGTLGGKLEMP